MAVLLVGLGSASNTVVSAVYDGRTERTGARAPVLKGGSPTFLFAHTSGKAGLAPVAVTYLEPLTSDAPVPPGVRYWPGPSEVYISPALIGAPVVAEYGSVAGAIGAEGLGSPVERMIYVRPAAGAEITEEMEGANSYGQGFSHEPGSEQLNVKPAWLLWLFITLFILCPSIVLLGAAALCGARIRAPGLARLEILGASPGFLMRLVLSSIVLPVSIGAAASLAVIAVACFVDIPLPGYAIYHGDVTSHLLSILASWFVGILIAGLAIIALSYPHQPHIGTRPRVRPPRYRGWVAISGAVAVIACGQLGIMQAQAQSNAVILFALMGTIVLVAVIPIVLGWTLRWVATAMARSGWIRGAAGRLVAGRDLHADLRAAARLASVNAVIVFTVTQASMFNLLGMSDAAAAEATYRAVDGEAATIAVPQDATQEQMGRVLAALPVGNTPVLIDSYSRVVDTTTSEDWSTLTAAPADFAALGIEPGEVDPLSLPQPLSTLLSSVSAERVLIEESDSPAGRLTETPDDLSHRSLAVVATGTPVDVHSLRGAINRAVAPGWDVEVPGEGWRVGAWITAHQSRWVAFTGSIGAVILLAAVWLRALDDHRETTRRLGLLSAVLGGQRITRTASAWRIGITTGMGVLIGALIAWQYSGMVTAMGAGVDPPLGLLAGLCLIALGMAAVVWLISVFDGGRAMAAWRPGRDHE